MLTVEEIVSRLKSLANPENVAGMKRFAVGGKHTLGISIPALRKMAKEIGRDHDIAAGLSNLQEPQDHNLYAYRETRLC